MAEEPTPRGSSNVRVLLVDDDAEGVELLGERLRRAGHDVRTAADASAAIAVFVDFAPQVAVIDIGLPAMNGYELAQRLREYGPCRMFALSGFRADSAVSDTKVTSFDEHFVKPVNFDSLLRAIASSRR